VDAAQARHWHGAGNGTYNVCVPFSACSGCSQATALLARMNGSQNSAAVTMAVWGTVTDGSYSLLDGLSVFAINSTGNPLVN
jgi:hypothetical protein